MIAVVSHDAGGAEIVSSYVRAQRLECRYVLDGPARPIFEGKLGNLALTPMDEALAGAEWVLCSTSFPSELEWTAMRKAVSLGKKTVAFLDHWINYRERFIRDGEAVLPHEIWVGDSFAEGIARRVLPGVTVKLVENPHFADIRRELSVQSRTTRPRNDRQVLYVTEPLRRHALRTFGDERHFGYTEEEAIRYFLENLHKLGNISQIVLRPHPSECISKYDWLARDSHLPVIVRQQTPLLTEILESGMVVGCNTMAMVIALLAERRVVCSIPPEGRPCSLPHRQIESLRDL